MKFSPLWHFEVHVGLKLRLEGGKMRYYCLQPDNWRTLARLSNKSSWAALSLGLAAASLRAISRRS